MINKENYLKSNPKMINDESMELCDIGCISEKLMQISEENQNSR